ncbi:ATP-binding protein, partial [Afifella marina]
RGARCAADYQARLSGPLIDRIDLRIEVPALSAIDLIGPAEAEPSAAVRERVAAARAMQAERYMSRGLPGLRINARAGSRVVEDVAAPDEAGARLIRDAAEAMGLSARGYHRVLKVARTLADLDQEEKVRRIHVAEALSYRQSASLLAAAA